MGTGGPAKKLWATKVVVLMKANAEPLDGNKVKLSIEVDESEIETAVDAAFKSIARQINIPGFRPGKAPRKLVEARVGSDAARAQALNDALPGYYAQALEDTDTDAIAAPEIDISSGETEGPVVFEAVVETRPVPNIAGYDGLQVTVPNPEPTDEEIDAQIERMQKQSADLNPVERAAQAGDFATIDIQGIHEGEAVPGLTASDYSYEVGSGLQSLGAEFDSRVEGSSVGDVLEFTSPVPPNDLEVEFRVEVKAINERVLPELTDEWANEQSEFETLEELRADIAKGMASVRKSEVSNALRTGAIEALSALVTDDVPEALVDQEMQRQLQEISYRMQQQGMQLSQFLEMTGQSQEDFVEQLREASIASVRADLALRAVATKQEITVEESEVDDEIALLAQQFGQKANQLRKQLERAERMPEVRSDIRKSKALRWLMDNVEVVDADGKAIDRSLIEEDEEDHTGHDHD